MCEIKEFFDTNYSLHQRYWWKKDNRFSIDESLHTPYYAEILKEAKKMNGKKTAIDIGAGEGADAIRLAKLGFSVDAIELSSVGAEKIVKSAKEESVNINVICADIQKYELNKEYDIILCNGVLHYIKDKKAIIVKMQEHTKLGGINCISLFSSYTPVPGCHKIVSVYPDSENGIVENMYKEWDEIFKIYEHEKQELSHNEMEAHCHSFIKLISRRIQK